MSKNTQESYVRSGNVLDAFIAKLRFDVAIKAIRRSGKTGCILDVGCGENAMFLRQVDFRGKFGVDFSLATKETADGIQLSSIDLNQPVPLSFQDDYFDVITFLAVIEHIHLHNVQFVLKQLYRVLRKQGILILTTPAPWSDKLLRTMANCRLISKEEIEEHQTAYSHRNLSELLQKAGFEKDKIHLHYFECGLNIWAQAEK